MISIEATLLKSQLCWTGHVIRMDNTRIPKQLFFGVLKNGNRKTGRPKLCYKDTIKQNLKRCNIKPKDLESSASDRSVWRSVTHKAVTALEESRAVQYEKAKEKRHRTSTTSTPTLYEHRCNVCGRLCASGFGLRSNMRYHRSMHS